MKSRPRVAAPKGPETLAAILAQELKLYRELYILADRQRDWLEDRANVNLCDLLDETAAIQTRIEESEGSIQALRDQVGARFEDWSQDPSVAAYLDRIQELIARTREIIQSCLTLAEQKKAAFRDELNRMGVGRLLLKQMGGQSELARFVDHRP
ncbi:MAG: flagellar export chaperone FlgN [Candidatus Zixiibacteriota bacterium]